MENSKCRKAFAIMSHPGMELLGYSIEKTITDSTALSEVIIKNGEVYPVMAMSSVMDLSLEAEAFGCKIEFRENEMPFVLNTILSDYNSVENLKVPDLLAGRIPIFIDAAKRVVKEGKEIPLFAGVIGPFSLAGRLYGMSEIMMACYIEPETVELLIEKCYTFIHSYCKELKKIGCDGVLIAEPAAGLMSNDDCMKFSSVYIKKIVEDLQDDNFLVILHNCGNRGHCTDAMLCTGAKACHFGNAANMVEILKSCPKDIVVMGNVDPVGVLKQLEPNEVREYVYNLLVKTSEFDNYVLSTGCDLPPGVPLKNIEAFFDALNDYNQ